MTSQLALRAADELDVMTLGTVLSKSGYFQDAREAAQAVVKVLAGREMGFGPIASMTGIHIINGKPTVSANLLAAAIKRSGKYDYQVNALTPDECVIMFWQFKRNGEPVEIGESRFTLDDAKQAGALTGKNAHTWKAYGRNMLFARAISNGARWYCPDIFGGPVYTPEELGAAVTAEGEIVDVTPPAQQNGQYAAEQAERHEPAGGEERHELLDALKTLRDEIRLLAPDRLNPPQLLPSALKAIGMSQLRQMVDVTAQTLAEVKQALEAEAQVAEAED